MHAEGKTGTIPLPGAIETMMACLEAEERSLIRAAQSGDHAAFAVLVDRHASKVASVSARFLQNPGEIEDVVQETFVRAWQSLAHFRGEASFRTWLLRMAINACKNRNGTFWSRRVRLTVAEDIPEIVNAQMLAEASLLQAETRRNLEAALRNLPEKFRLPITLHYFEDLSGAEIAGLLGWNESTVWSRLYAGCRALRKRLGTSGEIG